MTAQDSGKAELMIAGYRYGGWKLVRVARSIEQMAGSFELEISERWPGQREANPIKPGAACQLLLDGEVVSTGWVDEVMPDIDASRHRVGVQGRDKTADLVDCSAIYKSGQWHNVKLDRLASDLIKPFGIDLVVEADVGSAFSSFSIQEGETVFECLERAARLKAVLLTSNVNGDLVITRAGKTQLDHPLVEGKNIKAARGQFSHRERFSNYTVKGQGRLGADGDQAHAGPAGRSTDPNIKRYRPLIVLADGHSHNASLRDRAEWERNVRQGRSARGSITVQGWRHPGGKVWQPNTLVTVTSPTLWLKNATLLVVGATYSLDERGTLTELAVANPNAFALLEGVGASKLFGKLKTREQRERREKVEDWGVL